MKKLLACIAIITLFTIGGCSTKFKIAAPYKNITVVWGLLDQADTAHYVRIEKAFLSNTLSAITMAQVYDSSYYKALNVKIERINSFGGVFDTIHLYQVDLDNEGYPKQPGTFFTAPNYAYKFTNALDPNYTYRLIITNPATGEVDSAETPIITDNNSGIFNVTNLDDSSINRQGLDFHSVVISNLDNLIFVGSYAVPQGYSFSRTGFPTQTSPVYLSELVIGFNWIDSNYITGVKTARSATDDLGFQTLSRNGFEYTVSNIDMYSAVKSALGTAPASTQRFLNLCSLTAYLATPDYATYVTAQSNVGVGLTGGEIEPIYTNLSGANVLGLFTSKGTRTGYIGIDYTTIDSMIVSPILTGSELHGTDYNGVISYF